VLLARFYRVPAHVIRAWRPDELAINWLVALRAMVLFARQITASPETIIVPAVNLSPLG